MASLQRHKSGWLVRWYGGKGSDGKISRFSRVFREKEDAKAFMKRIAPSEGRGSGRESLSVAMQRWTETRRAMGRIGEATDERERSIAQLWGRLLGDPLVAKVTTADIQGGLNTLAREGRSARTLALYRSKLSSFFRHCVLSEIVPRNPVEATIIPPAPKATAVAPSPEQAAELQRLADASDDLGGQLGLIVRIIRHTGARRNEALGLRWNCVDLDRAEVRVEASLVQVAGRSELKAPKTSAGVRTIPVAAGLVEALRAHRKAQAAVRLRAGGAWAQNDLVVCNAMGEPLRGTDVSRRVTALVKQIEGWPPNCAPLHGMRHLHGTMLNAAGVDLKTIQARMGHASPSITISLYVHATPELDRAAAGVFDGLE